MRAIALMVACVLMVGCGSGASDCAGAGCSPAQLSQGMAYCDQDPIPEACEGGTGSGGTTSSVDSRLLGGWAADAVIYAPDVNGSTYTTHLDVVEVTGGAKVTGLCPTGTGSITFKGSGSYLTWTGAFSCPDLVRCGNVVRFTSGNIGIENGTTLKVNLLSDPMNCAGLSGVDVTIGMASHR